MEFLHFTLQFLCLLGTTGFIISCTEQQCEIEGVCCDKCAPGSYAEKVCTKNQQTICKKCAPGFFSHRPNLFDRCEECKSCDKEYFQKCSPTTDASCSCGKGFLCSDNFCSKCERDKCVMGEKRKTIAVVVDTLTNWTKYTYECEPLCQNHEHYSEKENVCLPRSLCSAHGLKELFAGNKTHNAICQSVEMQKVYMVVIAGYVLLFVAIVVVFSYHSAKKIKKIKASQIVNGTTIESCPLSMEETVGPVKHKEALDEHINIVNVK